MSFQQQYKQALQQKLSELKAMQAEIDLLQRNPSEKLDKQPMPPKQSKVKQAKPKAPKPAPDPRKAMEKRAKEVAKARRDHRMSPVREKVFATRVIDMAELVPVALDGKTTVWVKPGVNPADVIRKFNERNSTKNEPLQEKYYDTKRQPKAAPTSSKFELKVLKPVDSNRFDELLEHSRELIARRTIDNLDTVYTALKKYITENFIGKKCKVVRHQEQGETWIVCLEYGNTDRANASITKL